MSFLVANLPPIHCFVRSEFLCDFKQTDNRLIPCIWVSIKSIRGQALRIEAYFPEFGALYDKLPLNAFVSRQDNLGDLLPLDYLQIWDCFSHDITVIRKSFLSNLSAKYLDKDKQWYSGNYLFTVDNCAPDPNIIDTTYSEVAEDHKSFNFIELENGQFAAQPNNRTIFLDPASNPKNLTFPDFKVCTKIYKVEQNAKWSLGDSDSVTYE
jgi:hypothetical protein